MPRKKFRLSFHILIFCLVLTACMAVLPGVCFGQDPCRPGGGDLCKLGVPTGAVFEFNESFITEAIRNAWDANGLGSPRGSFFLDNPKLTQEDKLDGYVKTEPLAIGFRMNEDHRRKKWADRKPGYWDDFLNFDDNVYPENDNNANYTWWKDDYLYLPLADDCNSLSGGGCLKTRPTGGFFTFAAESSPQGFFDGLTDPERTKIRQLSDSELEQKFTSLSGWPKPSEVNDPDTGIGPGAYSILMCFAKNFERAPHTDYSRYTFFHPGPNWLRILSPIALIREIAGKPKLELRFPLFGVYNPLGCAKWYYQNHQSRTFSDNDIKVSWAVLVIRAGIKLDMTSKTPVLEIEMDPTDSSAVSFIEGNLNEELDTQISALTVDTDWVMNDGSSYDWYKKVKGLMNRRYDQSFGIIDDLVKLGIIIADINNLLTIPLDPLMENYYNLQTEMQKYGFTFKSLGMLPDPLSTTRFTMWEEKFFNGKHKDGICALGMDFMIPIDDAKFENAKKNFIPVKKQFALSLSNYMLNLVLPPIADKFAKPTSLPGGSEDRCGNKNLVDHFQITDLKLKIPSGPGTGGIPQITNLKAEAGLRVPWWAYLAAAALIVVAIICILACWGFCGWAFLALTVTIFAAVVDLDINHYDFTSTYAQDKSTFKFLISHENSLPMLDAELNIGEVHAEEEFSTLAMIINPIVGPIFTFLPEWISISFDDPISVKNVLLTAFRFSLNQVDDTVGKWLKGLQDDYKAAECSGANRGSACNAVRTKWLSNETYHNQVTLLKANYLQHRDYEMVVAGQFCRPPAFYDLEEVFQGCDEDDKPTATTIDQCANFYDDDFDGKEASCEDFVAICNNCSEAISAGGDTINSKASPLSVGKPQREEMIAGILNLWRIIFDCDIIDAHLLENIIIQKIAYISQNDYNKAQSVLQCKPYGSYTPPANCKPNQKYKSRMQKITNLRNEAGQDLDNDGKPDGLSEEGKKDLSNMGKEVQEEAQGKAGKEDDWGLIEFLENLIVEMEFIDCPRPDDPEPYPPIDNNSLWEIPWSDPDIDKDGFDRFGSGPLDCNDFNPAINPAAKEICNNEDDDCDGLVDEGFDNDGDGVSQCAEPPDCDDGNPAVSPYQPEICENYIDDDCDEEVDEEDCVGCVDEDGDGYSSVGGPCGEVDCDDTDSSVYPGAPETPGNGIDNNCNGLDDCFIATAAFGTPLDERINLLRQFRDQVLLPNTFGCIVVNSYYRLSPPVSRLIERHEILQDITRWWLKPMISFVSHWLGKSEQEGNCTN